MTKVLRLNHHVKCTRDQVARLLKEVDPDATIHRRSNRLVCF